LHRRLTGSYIPGIEELAITALHIITFGADK